MSMTRNLFFAFTTKKQKFAEKAAIRSDLLQRFRIVSTDILELELQTMAVSLNFEIIKYVFLETILVVGSFRENKSAEKFNLREWKSDNYSFDLSRIAWLKRGTLLFFHTWLDID